MPAHDLRKAKRIFDEAVDLSYSAQREFLIQACAGDAVLFADVQEMLAEFEINSETVESPVGPVHAHFEPPFTLPDRFLLRRRLGAGAFGTVYEAFDRDRHEDVA